MRIDRASLTFFKWTGIPTTRYNQGSEVVGGESELALLEIGTDSGIVGRAFLGSAVNPGTLDGASFLRVIRPLLMGQDPLERERLNARLWEWDRIVRVRMIGAVDVALWDIAGQAAQLPIHALIGTYRHTLPAYASSPKLPSPEAYADEAIYYKERNWGGYKLHPPQQPKLDIKCCEAVRRAVGDDYRVMLDATWAYDFPAALRVGRAIEEMDYYWYEDPLGEWDIYNYVKLRQKLDIPILATEFPAMGLEQYAHWLQSRATDFLRGDVALKGGITTCLKAAHLAEAFGMTFEVHHGGNSLNNVANLHICMAIRNTTMFEVLLPADAHKYGLVEEIEVDGEGLVHAPTKPGLGHEIDLEMIRSRTTSVLGA